MIFHFVGWCTVYLDAFNIFTGWDVLLPSILFNAFAFVLLDLGNIFEDHLHFEINDIALISKEKKKMTVVCLEVVR